MSRNALIRADRDRAWKKPTSPVSPGRPSTKKRAYSSDSSGGSMNGANKFRSGNSNPRKRLSIQNRNKFSGAKPSISAESSDSTIAGDGVGNEEAHDEDEDDDDDDDYAAVDDIPVEDLTGENDNDENKLHVPDFYGSQLFGEYNETMYYLYDDPEGPETANGHGRKASQSSEKRVRFDAAFMSSSSSDTASEDGDFPDLFTAIDDLPAPMRNEYYEESPEPSENASEDGPWWDWLQAAAENVAASKSPHSLNEEELNESSSEESEMSDYDDDTEVEDNIETEVEVSQIRAQTSSTSSPSRPVTPRNGRKPVAAAMQLDQDKEYATTVDGKVVLFKSPRAQVMIRRSREMHEMHQQALLSLQEDIVLTNNLMEGAEPEIVSSSGDLNAMFGAHGGLIQYVDVSNPTMLPEEMGGSGGSEYSPGSTAMDYAESDQSEESENEGFNMEDYILNDAEAFDEDNSDIELGDEPLGSPTTPTFPTSPAESQLEISPTTPSATAIKPAKSTILGHLDKNKVGSFRNHQEIHRRLSALGPDPAQRVSAATPVRLGQSADFLTPTLRRRPKSNTHRKSGRSVQTTHLRQKRGSGSFSRGSNSN